MAALSSSQLNLSSVVNLPIVAYKSSLVEIIRGNQVVVIYGRTGMGKSTQIPKYILQAGLNNGLKIGITQPWNIGVVSMSKRVAEEVECVCGMEVGYETESDNQSNSCTKIKYMTENILLNHCIIDGDLSEYGIIMVDEAHERTVYTDLILGILKNIITKRKSLKVIITSAKVKNEQFSAYFNQAPIFRLESHLFQMVLIYEPIKKNDFVTRSASIVERIHRGIKAGDILIFLPTQNEVDNLSGRLERNPNLVILKLYESMESQQNVFVKIRNGQRRVIISTNIAESVFTITSVRFVIDCGLVSENSYNPILDMNVCKEVRISKERADMRKERVGLSDKGWCYRIYRKDLYPNFSDCNVPDIIRKNLCDIYIKIAQIGLDPLTFDFIDPPDKDNWNKCEKVLQDLGLLDSSTVLTDIGRNLGNIPLNLVAGKLLISSFGLSCADDIAKIMAIISEKYLFNTYIKDASLIQSRHKTFYDEDGDHFTRLNIFNSFVENKKSKEWCDIFFLNYDVLVRVEKLKNNLIKMMNGKNLEIQFVPPGTNKDQIKSLIIKYFYKNVSVKKTRGIYYNYFRKKYLYMDKNSCLFEEQPNLIIYNEVIQLRDPTMSGIMKIDEALLNAFPTELEIIKYNAEHSEKLYINYLGDDEEGYWDPFKEDYVYPRRRYDSDDCDNNWWDSDYYDYSS